MVISMSQIGNKFNLANRFIFDPNNNSLIDKNNDDDVIRLGSNESRILLLLAENPNQVVTRNELHDFVWREQGFEVDDSSLTQAISTLRKMLHDSTRSPEFVKTVPKRGYQLICDVETDQSHHQEKERQAEDTPLPAVEEAEEFVSEDTHQVEPIVNVETQDTEPTAQTPKVTLTAQPKQRWSPLAKLTLLIAILLPVAVFLLSEPSQSKFRDIAVFDNVPIRTPMNHPSLDAWLPSIELCVNQYKKKYHGKMNPIEIIATGGQGHQLVLNYIHALEHSSENITLRIFADQNGLNKVCQ